MATTVIYTSDTITVRAEFRDANNTLVDADSNTVTFTVYRDDNAATVATATATRESTGIYKYDWLVPTEETSYVLEMKGNFSTKPQLKRIKARAKFRP